MTKRALSALCVLFILTFLSGCGKAEKTAVTDFSADFTAVYRDMELRGRLTADRRGLLTVELDSPDTLDGTVISYKNGEAELKRDGLICTADEAFIPRSGFPSLLKAALRALNNEIYNKNPAPKSGSYVLGADNDKIEILTDENGFISTIKIGSQLEVALRNAETIG